MSWLENLLCKFSEGLLYRLALELDSWGPLHSILRRPKGKLCLLVIFSYLFSCPSSACWDVPFPPGVPTFLTHKSATYLEAKFSWAPTIVLYFLEHGPDLYGDACSFRTPMNAYMCVCVFGENYFTGHGFIESKYLSTASNFLNVWSILYFISMDTKQYL